MGRSNRFFALLLGMLLFTAVFGEAGIINVPTATHPTIQAALNDAMPGDVIQVQSGVYNEKIIFPRSGNASAGYITLMAVTGAASIIDGSGLPAGDMVLIPSRSYVKIIGFEIRNNLGVNDASGIRVTGAGSFIEIRNNRIHEIRGQHAMGITIYGTEVTAISNLIIDSNEIYDCDPADSEALTLNGNVTDFEVTNNIVRDVNNIGIDFIGGETDIQPDPALVTRNGVCRGNQVYRANHVDGYAGGIYVDGGKDIVIENNIVSECDLGIEIGAENAGFVTSGVIVRNNRIYRNQKAGLVFGGYDVSVGRTANCKFLNNVLFKNDVLNDGVGEVWIQYAENNILRNNIFFCTGQNILLYSEAGNINNTLDYNQWYTAAGAGSAQFIWRSVFYGSFTAYRNGTGQDANSQFGNPLFVSAAAADFHVAANSPVINKGDPAFVPDVGEVDIDNQPRLSGGRVDIGADEIQQNSTPSLTINNVTVTEGNSGTVTASFTVTLSPSSSQTVTVSYATANGTATAGSDYTTGSGTLTFPANSTTQVVAVMIHGDVLDEANETFLVNLSNATNATIADNQGQGTITDDDPTPTLSINDVTVTEGNAGTTTASFTVTLSVSSGQNVTVNYTTANGTATAGGDYVSVSGTATFPAGSTTQPIAVTVNGDLVDEPNETFFVNLSSATNATIADNQGLGTITDDDLGSPNLALGKPTTAKSTSGSNTPAKAVDGNGTTYWQSGPVSSKTIMWIYVDLQSVYNVGRVVIKWRGSNYAKKYQIETSLDGSNYSTAYTDNAGNGGTDDFTFPTVSARYVEIWITQNNSSSERVNEFEVYAGASTMVKEQSTAAAEASGEIPDVVTLAPNFPNPFNPTTQISYSLPSTMHTMLKIYSISGQEVATLVNEVRAAGTHTVTFDASRLTSGVYFSVLQAGEVRQVRRLVFMK